MTEPSRSSGRRPIATAVTLLVAAAVLGTGGWLAWHESARAKSAEKPFVMPPTPVSVAEAIERSVVEWDEFSGRLETIGGVEIRSRVAGTIDAVNFTDGALVNKGDTLIVIDPKPYAAEVARAEAALASAEARLALTKLELARSARLLDDRAIAQREFDERQHANRQAQADLQGAQAALQVAKLNLGYTRITAPIAGRVGRAEVRAGNLVGAGAGGPMLTSIVPVSPVYATFDADERTFLKLMGTSHGGAFRPGDRGAARIPVQMGLANEEGHPHAGTIEFIDNRLDARSGTIRMRAAFDNADGRLAPGLYARLKLAGSGESKAVLVNDRAVATDQHKKYVYVVGDDNKVAYREIKLGPNVDGLRVVRDGLQPGERVVVNGLQRVRPGASVAPTAVAMDGKGEPPAPQQRAVGKAAGGDARS